MIDTPETTEDKSLVQKLQREIVELRERAEAAEERAEKAEKFNIYDDFFANDEELKFRILNHQGVRVTFGRQVDLIKRRGKLTILALDLDGLKYVNDTLGHLVGDDLIRNMGKTLNTQLRHTDLIGHPGGDEFIIGLVDTDKEMALQVAEKIIGTLPQEIRRYIEIINHDQTTSIGIYQVEENDSLESAREKADKALYHAKRLGKNQAVIFQTPT